MFCELNGNIGGVRYTLVTLGTLRHCDSRVTLVNSVLLGTHFACVTLVTHGVFRPRSREAAERASSSSSWTLRVPQCYSNNMRKAITRKHTLCMDLQPTRYTRSARSLQASQIQARLCRFSEYQFSGFTQRRAYSRRNDSH